MQITYTSSCHSLDVASTPWPFGSITPPLHGLTPPPMLLLCSPSSSVEPFFDGSNNGQLQWPPHLMEYAATCGLRISRSLPPPATSASHGACPLCVAAALLAARPPYLASGDHKTCHQQPASPWSQAHGAAPGLPPVPHVAPPTPPCRSPHRPGHRRHAPGSSPTGFTTSMPPRHARCLTFATGDAARRRLAFLFATSAATRRWLTSMLPSTMHLVGDSDMDNELLMAMASAHGHHLLTAGAATYRAA